MKKTATFLITLLTWLPIFCQVVIYTDCNYSGRAQTLTTKSYYNASQMGLADNSISSIKIPNGYKITVYTDADMKGREVTLSENQNCLPSILNDAISSIVVSKTSNSSTIANNGKISMYKNCDYRGSVTHFSIGNYADLKKALKNNTVQSIQIPQGLRVELYRKTNYKGQKIATYTSNQKCTSLALKYAGSMKVINDQPHVTPQPRKTN